MRILFAAQDRDLLRCYARLLEDDETTVQTAFDGTQVLSKLRETRFDLLIVSEDIPRIPLRQIISYCNDEGFPVLVLTAARPRLATLLDTVLASAYLPLPFTPDELSEKIRRLRVLQDTAQPLAVGHICADASRLLLGSRRITAEEFDVLSDILENRIPENEWSGVCIGALNEKLSALGISQRIRYLGQEGFKMVTEHE